MKLKDFFLLLFANVWVDSLLIDDLGSLKTCGSKKQEGFEDREYLPPEFNSYSVKLKFNRQSCTGSIIQERTVLTAGHCCHEIKDNPTVYFGEFGRRGDWYFDSMRFNITARKVILHPEYRILPTQFDACLVFLNDSIYDVMPENCSRSGCVEPVCLPDSPVERFTNYTAISSGFGRKTWMVSKTLDHYSGSILTEEMCLLHENMQKKKLHSGHFCIGNLKTINEKGNLQVDRNTFCDGFSGSPLVVNNDGYATIVGILSWGGRCGRYKKERKYNPLVFQKVHSILPWIQKHIESESFLIKITVSTDVAQIFSEPTDPPKIGAEPTKLPSILNTTLPDEETPIPSVSTFSISKQTPRSSFPEAVTDTEAAFVTSRKHLDSVSLDRQSEEDHESEGDVGKVVEIPSTSEMTFQAVNLATESTTKPAQSLPEASKSIDTDLVTPEIQNVKLEKLSGAVEDEHEILNKTNSSPEEEFTEVNADKNNFHLPRDFISASNSDLSEAIEGSFEPETNITELVDNTNGNQNINAHFLTSDSSHTPELIEDLPSDSQSINLSGKRDQTANMDEILLPNFDSENDYIQVIDGDQFIEIPPVIDPDSGFFLEKSNDYFVSYSDFYVDDNSDYWQEKEGEINFEEAPTIFSETKSFLDELGKDINVEENSFEISIMQEKDRVPIVSHSSYQSSYDPEVIEPPIEWVYSAAQTISSLSTTKPSSATPNTHRSISATLSSTTTTTTSSTTTRTTSPEPKTTSTHISTSTRRTGAPYRTPTTESARETRTSTTIESTTTTSTTSTTSTSTSSTKKTEQTTTTKAPNTTSTTETPTTSKGTTTTPATTESTTIKTTTPTTTSTTVKATETEKTTTTTSSTTPTKTIEATTSTTTPPTTTHSTTKRSISTSTIAKIESTTTTKKSTKTTTASTTSIFKSESAKMPISPVNTPPATSSTIPKTDEQTISSISTTSSTRHRRKHRTRKPNPDKKFSRKNSIKNKQNSGDELVTPKNVAALTQSPVSMDFSSVPAAMSSDAMHSTTSKIIGVDFYQEIVYETEEKDSPELPLGMVEIQPLTR